MSAELMVVITGPLVQPQGEGGQRGALGEWLRSSLKLCVAQHMLSLGEEMREREEGPAKASSTVGPSPPCSLEMWVVHWLKKQAICHSLDAWY